MKKMTIKGWMSMAVVVLVAGCSTPGYQQASKTAQSLQATRAELIAGRQQIAGTVALLDQLAAAPQADLRPLYAQLEREFQEVNRQASRAASRADQYRKNADAYVQAWSEEVAMIESASVRQASAERRAQSVSNFRDIEAAAAGTRAAYQPFVQDIQGVVQHLGLDLTAGGVAAVKPQIDKARQDARTLQAQVARLISELDRVTKELAPSTAAPAGM